MNITSSAIWARRSASLPQQAAAGRARSVNKPDGEIEFDYRGQADYLIKGIKVEQGRWLADLLIQLSDKQIEDAYRAANYSKM